MGKGPERCWSLDAEGRSHPAKLECRVVPQGQGGRRGEKGEGKNVWSQGQGRGARARDKASAIQGQIILLLVTTVDIYGHSLLSTLLGVDHSSSL